MTDSTEENCMQSFWCILWAHDEPRFSDSAVLACVLRTVARVARCAGILLAHKDSPNIQIPLDSLGVPVRPMPTQGNAAEHLPDCQAFLALCSQSICSATHIVRLLRALEDADIVFTRIPPASDTMPYAVRREYACDIQSLPSLPVPCRTTRIARVPWDESSACHLSDSATQAALAIGHGYDVHRFGGKRPCVLGGVPIPTDLTVDAHSDGDVLLHAIADALLGAAALGDIGDLFPPSDPRFDGISSGVLLDIVVQRVKAKGLTPIHLDCTIIAQKPKIAPYRAEMRANIARLLDLPEDALSVKATTEEKLGFTGRVEGIKAEAVVLCQKKLLS